MSSTAALSRLPRRIALVEVAPSAPPCRCVHELSARYEDEGSTRAARGAVSVTGGSWWSVVLSVPLGEPASADDTVAMLRVTRHGPARGAVRSGADATLLVPVAEADSVVSLLAGVVAQARRDGVLPHGGSGGDAA